MLSVVRLVARLAPCARGSYKGRQSEHLSFDLCFLRARANISKMESLGSRMLFDALCAVWRSPFVHPIVYKRFERYIPLVTAGSKQTIEDISVFSPGQETLYHKPTRMHAGPIAHERGYPEPFGLLEPPAQNPGCCHTVPERFSGFSAQNLWNPLDPPWTPWTPLHPLPHPSFFVFLAIAPNAPRQAEDPCAPSNPGFAECLP